jgi:hypothetical protein
MKAIRSCLFKYHHRGTEDLDSSGLHYWIIKPGKKVINLGKRMQKDRPMI